MQNTTGTPQMVLHTTSSLQNFLADSQKPRRLFLCSEGYLAQTGSRGTACVQLLRRQPATDEGSACFGYAFFRIVLDCHAYKPAGRRGWRSATTERPGAPAGSRSRDQRDFRRRPWWCWEWFWDFCARANSVRYPGCFVNIEVMTGPQGTLVCLELS